MSSCPAASKVTMFKQELRCSCVQTQIGFSVRDCVCEQDLNSRVLVADKRSRDGVGDPDSVKYYQHFKSFPHVENKHVRLQRERERKHLLAE